MLKVTEMNNNEMEFELERMEEGGAVTQEMFVWTVAYQRDDVTQSNYHQRAVAQSLSD